MKKGALFGPLCTVSHDMQPNQIIKKTNSSTSWHITETQHDDDCKHWNYLSRRWMRHLCIHDCRIKRVSFHIACATRIKSPVCFMDFFTDAN